LKRFFRHLWPTSEQIGIKNAKTDTLTLFALQISEGEFIGLGAIFAAIVTTGPREFVPMAFPNKSLDCAFRSA
jgi:formate/nitrite transporter FocA (FNT family)